MRKQVLLAAVALFALTGVARAYDPADLPAGCVNPPLVAGQPYQKPITKHYCDLMITAIKADEMKNAAVEKTKEAAQKTGEVIKGGFDYLKEKYHEHQDGKK